MKRVLRDDEAADDDDDLWASYLEICGSNPLGTEMLVGKARRNTLDGDKIAS